MHRTRGGLLLLPLLTAVAASAQGQPVLSGGFDPRVRAALVRASEEAGKKLARPGCQALLTEFADARGRPLAESLATLGLPAHEFLGYLIFRDGSAARACSADPHAAFVTAPNSRVVYVCGTRIARWEWDRPHVAAALIVHEALHSLGLGENPPSSMEITDRVLARCG